MSQFSTRNRMERKKVPLAAGHTLLDWHRLANSGKDLAGTRGQFLRLTASEVRLHNKKDDCWCILGGRVYNITEYLDFHPGGIPKLMLSAGKDGTDLFSNCLSF